MFTFDLVITSTAFLGCWTLRQAVWVLRLGWVVVLLSWEKHFTLTVLLTAPEYWQTIIEAEQNVERGGGGACKRTSILSMGSGITLSCFLLQKWEEGWGVWVNWPDGRWHFFLLQIYIFKSEEEIETRAKLVDGLKTALRTQPLRCVCPL